ncbi:hypothetical protein NA56DRAFT_723555 [Hyaloscypha hepaticicola]|uniref:Uncharacterized protein n=1 Tax=Hyaloscypha hepaticicola TaxID=2082293 RepID=A0A2J6Q0Z1_9HELO|nr:hypothetical protein NA56DRAFT_723555 [Hyaloscypha hepaticicola]
MISEYWLLLFDVVAVRDILCARKVKGNYKKSWLNKQCYSKLDTGVGSELVVNNGKNSASRSTQGHNTGFERGREGKKGAESAAKIIAITVKAKATRARNKATVTRIDRILQSSPLPTTGLTGPSGPSETIGSNSAVELIIARADPIIYSGNIKFDPNKTPLLEEKIIIIISKTKKHIHLIDIVDKDLSTDSNSSDSQSNNYTQLSKSELTQSLKKKTQRKFTRLKAKKERAQLRARITVIS